MRSETIEEVIAHLARARDAASRAGRAACVAFDGDGTLWSGDVGEDLFFALADEGEAIREPARAALAALARAHGVPDAGAPGELARRLFHAYEGGAFPEPLLYEATAWLWAGWRRDEVAAHVRAVLDRAPGFAARVHGEAARVVAWARREGVRVVVVSASPRPVVEDAAGRLGVAPGDVIALTARWEGDRMVPDVERPIPYQEGKVAGLRARLGDGALIGAFGDNAFDAQMLRAAEVAVAVRPKARLRQVAAEIPGLVELIPDRPLG